MRVAISSGHGKLIRGASGPEPWGLDEVDEARKVVNAVSEFLMPLGTESVTFADDVSDDQNENLNRIVDWHNDQERDIDVSIHFNAFDITTDKPMGTECLYLTQKDLATEMAAVIAAAGELINRGPKKRSDLFFLNKTDKPSILIELAFCDSKPDCDLYRKHFDKICKAIALTLSGGSGGVEKPKPETGLNELITIDGVVIYEKDNGRYIRFVSDLDICNDGCGPSHGDPHHQPMTAYYSGGREGGKYLNADVDKYIVIPPQVRSMIEPVIMGCQGRMTNLTTGVYHDGVTGEIGPDYTSGEAAYCLAKIINPSITYNSGDKSRIYLYEFWPDKPAFVDGFTYKLQPS
jgi:N-acetylmuramoyl-L-alanine amidase